MSISPYSQTLAGENEKYSTGDQRVDESSKTRLGAVKLGSGREEDS